MKANGMKEKTGGQTFRKGIAVAAAAVILTTGAAGMIPAQVHAASLTGNTFLGGLVTKVVKLMPVETQVKDDVVHVKMTIPKVTGLSDPQFEAGINAQIKEKMEVVTEKARSEASEAKKEWLKNGGKKADYMPLNIEVSYRIQTLTKDTLSFVVVETQRSASSYENQFYYNIDLNNSKEITLKQLLGENYIQMANEKIKAEIAERSKVPESVYYNGDEGVEGFTTIAADQSFYVNQAGNPVIVFNKYEIAPGFMGIQEFEIVK